MAKKTQKIPKFKNDAEVAAFFNKHDSTKYLSQTKPAFLKFPKPQHKVVIDLKESQWFMLQRLAHRKKMCFNHLLEKFVSEKLAAAS
jgi:hypothetical protein